MDILPVAKTIKMPCMRKGLVAYPETEETILLEQDVLAKMAKTAHGIPVVIEHPGIPIDNSSIKTIPIHGRVSAMNYDQESDEWIADFTVHTQEAVDLLKRGYGVSTGWYPKQYGPAGTYNNVPYTHSLADAEYEHLAIVSRPRYEMAYNPIFLNSKNAPCKKEEQPANIETKHSPKESKTGRRETRMFNLFRNKREEIKVNDGEDVMVNMGDQECKLADLVSMYKKGKEPAAPKKNMLGDDDMVDIDGVPMSVRELIAAVKGMSGDRKDASASSVVDAGDRSKEDVGFQMQDKADAAGVADAVANEAPAKEEESSDEESKEKAKVNSNFESLKSVHENGVAEEEEAWISTHKRMELGRARYGSPTK